MTDTSEGCPPAAAEEPQFTFQLAAKAGGEVPRFHTMMMNPGRYRISLVPVPGFTAFEYTRKPTRWITEFYLYRPSHMDPRIAVAEFLSTNERSDSPEEAFAKFKARVISIPGDWPLPVMFCIADAKDIDNQGGLSVLVQPV